MKRTLAEFPGLKPPVYNGFKYLVFFGIKRGCWARSLMREQFFLSSPDRQLYLFDHCPGREKSTRIAVVV